MGRKNRSDTKRSEIIKHVYDVIAESGIEGATLSRIANHMGIHKSLLTYYFHTKEEMIIALVDFITETYEKFFPGQNFAHFRSSANAWKPAWMLYSAASGTR